VIPTLGTRNCYFQESLSRATESIDPTNDTIAVVGPVSIKKKLPKGVLFFEDHGTGVNRELSSCLTKLAADHEFLAWIGDDDLLWPLGFQMALSKLAASKDLGGVVGHCQYIDARGYPLGTTKLAKIGLAIAKWGPNLMPQPGSIFRSRVFTQVGGLSPELSLAFDHKLFLDIMKVSRLGAVDATLASFRWHPDSLTVKNRLASAKESSAARKAYRGFSIPVIDQLVLTLTVVAGSLANILFRMMSRNEK